MSSTDAVNNTPLRRAPEVNSFDTKPAQKATIADIADHDGDILPAPEVLEKNYADALAFNEQPITILVQRSGEKHAPRVVDAWCNGRGAEVLIDGKWVPTGAIPVGIPVTTKRKYAEILARSKVDTVNTRVEDREAEKPSNYIDRYTSAKAPFSVLEDKDPRGQAWLANVVYAL